ncbi:MAG TPA: adenosylcobinamide-GDP ribazoletransferase, partial [Syntrophobacteraceae bacterium]|nr:adenosylcobinamide-GDP ribazoletransferase [Syntrophobacteraceae bacterium]
MLRTFALALSFLTILRVPLVPARLASPTELAASFVFFPLVGVILGGIWVLLAFAWKLVLTPALIAVLLTLTMALLTRGLHLDGLADLADGVGGGYTPEKRLTIMKDSRIGTFGATALILVLALKVSALYPLLQTGQWRALLLVPILSRLGMVWGAYRSVYPRPEGGLGKAFCEQLHVGHLLAATTLGAVAVVLVAPLAGAVLLIALSGCVGLLRILAQRWLGGITGDVLGALNEIAEALLLTVA